MFLFPGIGISQEKPQPFFVFLNTNPDRDSLPKSVVQKLQEGHMANIERLAEAGSLIGAGPFHNGGGIFIMRGDSLNEIHNLLATDPAIGANRFLIEVFPVTLEYGGICDAPDEYTMTSYQFVRFRPKSDVKESSGEQDWQAVPDHFQRKDSLIAVGRFEQGSGGFAVFDKQDSTSLKQKIAPGSKSLPSGYSVEFKRLWIARETFCVPEK
ncbi:MAG: hypothetical protein MAGBODY4_01540 [Candidatus Marinimicrobia bacterium]|nr:hypothetical protein [Candidatus Neomarinimicrobiota bacterium]